LGVRDPGKIIATYIMANRRNGTIYTGVTSDLAERVHAHREGLYPGFTARYGVKLLVWYEAHDLIAEAIRREKQIKGYARAWKINLIGCHWGLRVKPNTQSLGEGTTASVVTSITVVIIVDALFAVVFKNVGF